MISIVPIKLEHLPLLSRIGGQTIFESHGHSQPAPVMQAYVDEKFTEDALAAELNDPANIFHLISYNGEPAGYSKIIYNVPVPTVPYLNITKMERLYLLREFYGLKLGQALFQFNVDLSRAAAQAGMWLYVWKGNERAMKFYTKAGFEIVGDGTFRLTKDHANPNWQMFLKY